MWLKYFWKGLGLLFGLRPFFASQGYCDWNVLNGDRGPLTDRSRVLKTGHQCMGNPGGIETCCFFSDIHHTAPLKGLFLSFQNKHIYTIQESFKWIILHLNNNLSLSIRQNVTQISNWKSIDMLYFVFEYFFPNMHFWGNTTCILKQIVSCTTRLSLLYHIQIFTMKTLRLKINILTIYLLPCRSKPLSPTQRQTDMIPFIFKGELLGDIDRWQQDVGLSDDATKLRFV